MKQSQWYLTEYTFNCWLAESVSRRRARVARFSRYKTTAAVRVITRKLGYARGRAWHIPSIIPKHLTLRLDISFSHQVDVGHGIHKDSLRNTIREIMTVITQPAKELRFLGPIETENICIMIFKRFFLRFQSLWSSSSSYSFNISYGLSQCLI